MPFKDLRDFLNLLEARGLLARVGVEVDPAWEVNGIVKKVFLEGGPAMLFERVKESNIPLVVGVLGTEERFALALETTPDKIRDEWIKRIENPVKPKIVETGPCKENIIMGDDVDLRILPQVKWHKKDAAPYIGTLGIVITKDPETGLQNAGIYRMMMRARNETTVWFATGQHGWMHHVKWESMNKPMPMAVVFSTDPVVMMTAAAKFVHPPDEFEYAGALRGEAVEMVKCETIDIEVPATSEIVLEGEVPPKTRAACGPFGEWTGHVTIPIQTPIFKVKAITHRDNPIFWGTREDRAPGENALLWGKGLDHLFYKRMKELFEVKDAYLPMEGSGSIALVSIKKQFKGQAQQIILGVLGNREFGIKIKHVIVFNEDVDVRNPADILWALATRVDPARDVMVIPSNPYTAADVSQPPSKRGAGGKMGIDATLPIFEYLAEGAVPPEKCDDPDVRKEVEKRWDKYGIELQK